MYTKFIKGKMIAIRLVGLLSFCLLSMVVAKAEVLNSGLTVSEDKKCLTFSSDEGFKNWSSIKSTYKSTVTKVIIGKEVTIIPYFSFNAFEKITTVTIEEGSKVTEIGPSAFMDCTSLVELELNNMPNLKIIRNWAFNETSLTSVNIPASVITIEENAFYNCESLAKIEFSKDSKLETMGIAAFKGTDLTSVNIPALVITIEQNTFLDCKNLSKVEFSGDESKLETIKSWAFANTDIRAITIPASVITIENNAFYNCESLAKLEFSKDSKLETIGIAAFKGTGLTSVNIPALVITIEPNTFLDCKNLSKVEFSGDESKLETIKKSAFANTDIRAITIPASVITIEPNAFYNCKNLAKLEFSNDSKLETIGNSAFEKSIIESVEIPASVKIIKEQAFCRCSALSEVTFKKNEDQTAALEEIKAFAFLGIPIKTIELPPSIKAIDDEVFAECMSLERVILTGKEVIPTIGKDLFDGIDPQPNLCFPLEKNDEYVKVLSGYSLIPGYCQTTIKQPKEGTLIIKVKDRQLDNKDRVFEDESLINTLDADKKIKVSVSISYNDGFDNCEIYANEEKIEIGEYEVTKDVTFSAKNFTVQKVKINFSQPEHGTITVFDNDKEIHSGDEVDYGTELTINLTLSPGYQGGTIKVNGSEITNNTYTIKGDITITVESINESTKPPYVPDPPYEPVYYTVNLPTVEGASTDPVAGDYEVESWSSFRFYLTLDTAYNQSVPVVSTSRGDVITPRQSDGAYLVKYIRNDMEIYINGVEKNPSPVDNAVLHEGIHIRTSKGMLQIESDSRASAMVFDMNGRMVSRFDVLPGTTNQRLKEGIYLVKIGTISSKIIIW